MVASSHAGILQNFVNPSASGSQYVEEYPFNPYIAAWKIRFHIGFLQNPPDMFKLPI
jgi:hypothetical protein